MLIMKLSVDILLYFFFVYIFRAVHLCIIMVRDQIDAQFLL